MSKELISLSIMLSILITPSALAGPGEANGTVTYVVDGDTICIQIQGHDTRIGNITVRLADIDCPEINTNEGPSCRNYAYRKLNGSSITLDLDDKTGKDSMGRWVAVLFLPEQDGTLVNFNRMLVDSKHACILDFRNNEFDPLSWWNGTHPSEACKKESNKNDSDDCADVYNSKCSDGPIVGNAATARYHHPCCPHSRDMNLSDVVWFMSSEDAIDQGYLPCEVCCLQ